MGTTSLIDLPLDVLLLIVPYLSVHEFVALTSTCHHLHDSDELRLSSSFWSRITRHTFRVPNHPVVEADGQRWMRLYRRMHTQSRIFNWGKNDGGCFGSVIMREPQGPYRTIFARGSRARARGRMTPLFYPHHAQWPQMTRASNVGIVADLQCGGWSTVMLNSTGCLYVNGKIIDMPVQYQEPVVGPPKLLSYPPGFTASTEGHDANTAIEHFSAGRCHVLGLSDNGRLWTWSNAHHDALQVKFLAIDTRERNSNIASNPSSSGLITKVRAGFSTSSAYIQGKGIVVWDPVDNSSVVQSRQQGEDDFSTTVESTTVPSTGYTRPAKDGRDDDSELGSRVGQVRNWAVLGEFIVFVTDLDKVFAVPLPPLDQHMIEPFQVTTGITDRSETREGQEAPAADVQGSHECFGIIFRDGQVVTGDQDALTEIFNNHSSPKLKRIPCLQHTGVMSLAFGDYHFHALHADGNITSHGTEPQSCGALGLGGSEIHAMRGVVNNQSIDKNGLLLPECETTGRRVFFDQTKHHWTRNLANEDLFPENVGLAGRMRKAVASEWVEQRLRAWDSEVVNVNSNRDDDDDDDGLNPYFALSVAAGGWHSGAIVLVSDDEKKQAARQAREELERAIAAAPAQPPAYEQSGMWSSMKQNAAAAAHWFLASPSGPTPQPEQRPAEPCFNCTLNDKFCSCAKPVCEACRVSDDASLPRCSYPLQKDWWRYRLPRLRLPGGEVLPGHGPVADWTCPEFVTW